MVVVALFAQYPLSRALQRCRRVLALARPIRFPEQPRIWVVGEKFFQLLKGRQLSKLSHHLCAGWSGTRGCSLVVPSILWYCSWVISFGRTSRFVSDVFCHHRLFVGPVMITSSTCQLQLHRGRIVAASVQCLKQALQALKGFVSCSAQAPSLRYAVGLDESSRGRAPHSSDVRDTPECSPTRVSASFGRRFPVFGGCAVAVYGVHYWGSQSAPQSMAPETHTRYRVQRLIRLGEWLERNEAALIMAFRCHRRCARAAYRSSGRYAGFRQC